jgi:hypothetical protein
MTAAADLGARDAAIRCQTYSVVQRLEGVPPDIFSAYWRDVHGPLCSRLPGLGFYVQHHFSRDDRANLWPLPNGTRRVDFPLDGMVEIGFADPLAMQTFSDASSLLFGDEVNLFGWDAAYLLPNGSRTLVDRQADATPNGPDRLHRLHVHLFGEMDAAFQAWALEFASALADAPDVLKLRLHLPEAYDNANPQPPSPVSHVVRDDMLKLAVIEIGFDTALSARLFFASPAFQATAAGQSEHVRALAVYLVTGVYTFVRDGRPTQAGLRGSRAAEIIDRIGATNHVAPEVMRLFTRQ